MILRVDPDLSALRVCAERHEQEGILGYRQGQEEPLEVFRFSDPVLMTDTYRISAQPPGLRDALFGLYESYPRTVEYDGCSVSWAPQEFPRVWGPNIDTVFLARALRRLLRPSVGAFAEVGCGSGFLTKFALLHGQLSRALASDINLHALRCADRAISQIQHEARLSLVCPEADDPTLGFSGQFDLLVCNPPYIPRPDMRNNNPYEGLDLIAKLARTGPDLLAPGGTLLMNISSLSGELPEQWLAQEGWTVTLGETLDVPLKVNAVTSGLSPESRQWLDYLRDRGAIWASASHPGYEYWHKLRILECRRA